MCVPLILRPQREPLLQTDVMLRMISMLGPAAVLGKEESGAVRSHALYLRGLKNMCSKPQSWKLFF